MVKGGRILLAGLACAALLVASGYASGLLADRRVATAVAACHEASLPEERKHADLDLKLLCEADEIGGGIKWDDGSADTQWVGEQKVVADALAARRDRWTFWNPLAALVALLGAMPYLWYFLLRRLREVRDTLVGKE